MDLYGLHNSDVKRNKTACRQEPGDKAQGQPGCGDSSKSRMQKAVKEPEAHADTNSQSERFLIDFLSSAASYLVRLRGRR
eukprot:3537366-Pleurochrysis_carterae.AAC.1